MLNIGKEKVDFACESCGQTIEIRLEQAANEETIKCKYCGVNIHLKDNGSVQKSIRDINKSFNELEKSFKKLGNIKF